MSERKGEGGREWKGGRVKPVGREVYREREKEREEERGRGERERGRERERERERESK